MIVDDLIELQDVGLVRIGDGIVAADQRAGQRLGRAEIEAGIDPAVDLRCGCPRGILPDGVGLSAFISGESIEFGSVPPIDCAPPKEHSVKG